MKGCIHHWRCEIGKNGKVPALCLKCGADTVFQPQFMYGRGWETMGQEFLDESPGAAEDGVLGSDPGIKGGDLDGDKNDSSTGVMGVV